LSHNQAFNRIVQRIQPVPVDKQTQTDITSKITNTND
jgi:hypothetical protein